MRGPEITFARLGETENDAAVPVLLRGLDSSERALRDGCLRALLHRISEQAEVEILRRWHTLPGHWREMITAKVGWLSSAIRKGAASENAQDNANACAAAVETRAFDLIPVFVAAAMNPKFAFAERTAETALNCVEHLHDELAAARDYTDRRNPQLIRQFVLPSLEKAVETFGKHGRVELLEAYLLLAGRENAGLKHALQSTHDPVHAPLMNILTRGSRPAVLRLLLSYLDDPHAPAPVISLIGRRPDLTFLRQLFRRIGAEPGKVVAMNLRRIDTCGWLTPDGAMLDAVQEADQPGLVNFVALTQVDRALAQSLLLRVLKRGGVASRRVAAERLEAFSGAEADEAALAASHDADPYVRAFAAGQLRKRNIPGSILRLVEMVESSNEAERTAARHALAEFEFSRLLEAFDGLPPEVRHMTGKLVKKIDEHALSRLAAQLHAESRNERKRALELAAAMDAVAELHGDICQLLHDEDQFLRADAIVTLAKLDIPETRQALRDALTDPSPLVRETAERALADLSRSRAAPLGPWNFQSDHGSFHF